MGAPQAEIGSAAEWAECPGHGGDEVRHFARSRNEARGRAGHGASAHERARADERPGAAPAPAPA